MLFSMLVPTHKSHLRHHTNTTNQTATVHNLCTRTWYLHCLSHPFWVHINYNNKMRYSNSLYHSHLFDTYYYMVANSAFNTHFWCWWNKCRLHAGWCHVVAGQGDFLLRVRMGGTWNFQILGASGVRPQHRTSVNDCTFLHPTQHHHHPFYCTVIWPWRNVLSGSNETLIMRFFFCCCCYGDQVEPSESLSLLQWYRGADGLQRLLPWKRVGQLTLWPLKMLVHFAVTRRRMLRPANTNGCKAGMSEWETLFHTPSHFTATIKNGKTRGKVSS